ncbi:MAG: DNA-3-methyladenine glycosylase [Verrucomicrobiota bacterium]
MARLTAAFFTRDPVTCARELVGSIFHWHGCSGRIVETEAYAEVGDEACHTWNRPGARRFVESHAPGDAYVYLNYGVHWLFNFLVKGREGAGFVLLRAVEPIDGLETMRRRRPGIPDRLLGAGPGRLTRAFGISGADHGIHFLDDPEGGVIRGSAVELVAGGRVGISRAAERPWRFGEAASPSLSRKF